jgi:hypothetical protein
MLHLSSKIDRLCRNVENQEKLLKTYWLDKTQKESQSLNSLYQSLRGVTAAVGEVVKSNSPDRFSFEPSSENIGSNLRNHLSDDHQEHVKVLSNADSEVLAVKGLLSGCDKVMCREIDTVREAWKEYAFGKNGKPSLRKLEEIKSMKTKSLEWFNWRKNPSENMFFLRRWPLLKYIQSKLDEGVDNVVENLENEMTKKKLNLFSLSKRYG